MTTDILGIDIGGTKLLMICGKRRVQVETGSKFSISACERQIRQLIETLEVKPKGIGIAIPGLVDPMGSSVQACDVIPELVGWKPSITLANLDLPIKIINDVQAALLEEFHDAQPGITGGVVMVGTGIGAAFQVEGKLLLGACGWAGELGYLPLAIYHHTRGTEVKRLDQIAGGAAMAARLGTDGRDLAVQAHIGAEAALSIIREGGHALGLGLAAVINLLNPAKLTLGGGAWELSGYRESALASAQEFSLPDLWDACSISAVKSGGDVVALGAGRAMLE
jgi:predicted NBD/HSP70 family sugar kinase